MLYKGDAAPSWQDDVDNRGIDHVVRDVLDCFGHASDIGDDLEFRLTREHLSERLPDHRVIVDDERPCRRDGR